MTDDARIASLEAQIQEHHRTLKSGSMGQDLDHDLEHRLNRMFRDAERRRCSASHHLYAVPDEDVEAVMKRLDLHAILNGTRPPGWYSECFARRMERLSGYRAIPPFHVPACVEIGSPVRWIERDLSAEHSLMMPEEAAYDWRRCLIPMGTPLQEGLPPFKRNGLVRAGGADPHEERRRFANIRKWAGRHGGLAAALEVQPPLLLLDGEGFFLSDGWHRMTLASEERLAVIPCLVGISTTPRAVIREICDVNRHNHPIYAALDELKGFSWK
jgi:hypothetical protein